MIARNPIGWAAVAASLVQAGPLAVASPVEARGLESRTAATFDMAHSWNNEMLFDGTYPNGAGGMVNMAIECKTCYTKGSIAASITDATLVDPTLRLDFSGVEAYVDLAVTVSESAVYTINLFTSNTPIGMGVQGMDVGIVFAVDLVFSLSEKIELDAGGFQVTLAEGAFVEASLLQGTITKSFFDGLKAQSLPVSVKSGLATFKADLRVRTQCGAEGTSIVGIGAGLEVGVYANIIEFVSIIETSQSCGLQSREYWDCNVGAYAMADVQIDYKTFGAVPTISTTLLSAPTATQCWGSIASQVTSALGGGKGGGKYDGQSTMTFASSGSKETGSYGGDKGSGGKGGSSGSGSGSGSYGSGGKGGSSGSGSGSGSYGSGGDKGSGHGQSSAQQSPSFSPARNSSVAVVSSSPVVSSPAVSSTPASSPAITSSAVLSSSSPAVTSSVPATSASVPGDNAVTSTVLSTTTFTITSCAASVVNCPASYQTSYVITKTYTNKGHGKGPTGSGSAVTTTNGAHLAITPTTTNIIVLVPCTSPIVETFTPPTAVPTSGKGNSGSSGSGSSGSGSGSGSGSSGSGSSGSGSSGSSNGTLSGTFSPTASKTGSGSGVVVTAGAVPFGMASSGLAAAVGVFAAAVLL